MLLWWWLLVLLRRLAVVLLLRRRTVVLLRRLTVVLLLRRRTVLLLRLRRIPLWRLPVLLRRRLTVRLLRWCLRLPTRSTEPSAGREPGTAMHARHGAACYHPTVIRYLAAIAVVAAIGNAHASPCPSKRAAAQATDTPTETGCIDGDVIAVVAAYTGKLSPLELSGADQLEPKPDAIYSLMMPDSYARVVYLPVAGEPEIVEARQKKTAGLLRDAHLVRMEINAGKGASAGDKQLNGKVIEILDDTKAYPLNVSKLLHSTLAEFESAKSKRGARWRKEARKVADAAIKADTEKSYRGFKRDETLYAGYLARWSTETNTLHITFYGRLAKVFSRRYKTGPRQPGHRGPHPPVVFVQVEYRTEYAVDIEFDINGKLVGESESPAVSTGSDYGEFPEY